MKLLPILAACMAMFLMVAVSPAFASSVAFTYTLADLGQGGWGGGPLFTNGQANGANGISFANGANVGTFKATTWKSGTSAITNGGPGVDICGTLTVTKTDGTLNGLPAPGVYPFCLSSVLGTFIPITGAPVVLFGALMVRVTPVG
jgi:hypothetical protein